MKKYAKILLEKKAVTLNIKEPYTYTSGIRSPIYCDNRSLGAFPIERKEITKGFIELLKEYDFDIVAGTSTAGIQWAAWIAEELNLPFSYIRGSAKKHGKGKQIEGAVVEGKKVAVIEDLISTGGSSYDSAVAVKELGGEVVCVAAIFTYELQKSIDLFSDVKLITLTNFSELIEVAKENDYLSEEEANLALEWNKNPLDWGPNNGFPNVEK